MIPTPSIAPASSTRSKRPTFAAPSPPPLPPGYLQPSTPTDTNDRIVHFAGELLKLGSFVKSWKERYFVCSAGSLRYYKTRLSTKPIKCITLSPDFVCSAITPENPGYKTLHAPTAHMFVLRSMPPAKPFHLFMCAKSADSADEWIQNIMGEIEEAALENDARSDEMGSTMTPPSRAGGGASFDTTTDGCTASFTGGSFGGLAPVPGLAGSFEAGASFSSFLGAGAGSRSCASTSCAQKASWAKTAAARAIRTASLRWQGDRDAQK